MRNAANTKGTIFNRTAGADAVEAARAVCRQAEAGDCNRLVVWLSDGPVPESTGPQPGRMQTLDPGIAALLEDRRFAAAFGVPFDRMPKEELQRFSGTVMGRCSGPSGPLRGFDSNARSAASRALNWGNGPLIAQLRNNIATLANLTRQASETPATVAGYEQLAAQSKEGDKLQSNVPPATREAYQAALLAARRRVVIPVEAAMAEETARSAQGLAGLERIAEELKRLSTRYDDPQLREAQNRARSLLTARCQQIAEPIAADERARWATFGAGAPGVLRYTDWVASYSKSTQSVRGIAPVLSTTLSQGIARRADVMAQASSEMRALIAATETQEQLSTFASRYLLNEQDRNNDAGTRLLSAVRIHAYELRKREVLGPVLLAERRAGPPRSGEPSTEALYDAFQGGLNAEAEESQRLWSTCVRPQSAGDAALCLAGGWALKQLNMTEAARITSLRKNQCVAAAGKPGFVCNFSVTVVGGAGAGNSPFSHPILRDALDKSGVQELRFVRVGNDDRWIVQP